ncbi:ATM1 ABC-type transport system involved in Fe-S cluster assembly, permease and ATPase components [Burkholderiaceae bacterium]|jgi:ATP-binding cassette, subfamily B, heavy metal transporter
MLLKSTLLCVMRHPGSSYPRIPSSTVTLAQDTDWHTLKRLFPYLWEYKWRVMAALTFMVGAKVANVGVPLLLKELIDNMTPQPTVAQAVLVVPIALLVAYGLLRLSVSAFTELRELVFAEATQGAAKRIALETFEHLHRLSLRFHLERQTGGMSRDIERGVRGIESLIAYSLYSIVPTLIEVVLVLTILGLKFDKWYAIITLIALAAYIYFTVTITEWRTQFRKQVNEFDSNAHSRAIDSLLNYETVKYFGNEAFEAKRYDDNLDKLRKARIKAQNSLSALNIGQQLIIAVALVGMLWRATQGVVDGRMTLGDLVMINAFMIQLYIPLNFLGVIYREIKQSLTDLERMFELLEKQREVADLPSAQALQLTQPPEVRFENVFFAYEPDRPILHGISLTIPAGKTVAVVGPSGSGKSTLARLLFRFYDAQDGSIRIDGQDIKQLTQDSVRRAIGIVPQDTVLFNDTVYYNIAYGQTAASKEQVEEAAKSARIHDFIASTPQGYETMVGERGLKLSGGEKQRVAIARTLLKNPSILIFDEATSALDSTNERAIQAELRDAAHNKTTLVIAHRLSTVVDAHEIIVLDQGHVIERGTHAQLLAAQGRYAHMWSLQQSQDESP